MFFAIYTLDTSIIAPHYHYIRATYYIVLSLTVHYALLLHPHIHSRLLVRAFDSISVMFISDVAFLLHFLLLCSSNHLQCSLYRAI
jgi:hypothetical protein